MLDVAGDSQVDFSEVARAGVSCIGWGWKIWDWKFGSRTADEIFHDVGLVLAFVHLELLAQRKTKERVAYSIPAVRGVTVVILYVVGTPTSKSFQLAAVCICVSQTCCCRCRHRVLT